jgi:hypothetical protein
VQRGIDFKGPAGPVADTLFDHSCSVRPYKSIDLLGSRLPSTLSTAQNRPVATGGPSWVARNTDPVFGMEIADLCVGPDAVLNLNGRLYELQLEYSNIYHACVDQ